MKWNRWRDVSGAASYDAVFVNRDLAGRGGFFERQLLRRNPRVVFDFDDAIFIGRNEATVRWMCRNAAWVTPGNQYLAGWVERETKRFTVVPTVVDTEVYRPRRTDAPAHGGPVRVGWSGSDQSIRATLVPYLGMLAALQSKLDFELVVITNTRPTFSVPSLRWSFVPWTAKGDAELAERMDIGLMPLVDDEFSRGKCGLKLLQYMASGLPTVASPVGVNRTITLPSRTGFLADTADEWASAIEALVRSGDKRAQMGAEGRRRCEQSYSVMRWLPVLHDILSCVRRGVPVSGEGGTTRGLRSSDGSPA